MPRIGPQHQAGSDSLLTEAVFFKLRELFFDKDQLQEEKCGSSTSLICVGC